MFKHSCSSQIFALCMGYALKNTQPKHWSEESINVTTRISNPIQWKVVLKEPKILQRTFIFIINKGLAYTVSEWNAALLIIMRAFSVFYCATHYIIEGIRLNMQKHPVQDLWVRKSHKANSGRGVVMDLINRFAKWL